MKTLLERTMTLLKNSDKTVTVICQDTGISRRWINYLKAGEYSDPGVNKIEILYNYLSGKRAR